MSEKREQTPPESPEAKRQKLDSAEESSEYDTYDSGENSHSRISRLRRMLLKRNIIEQPWNYETENCSAQPPDINYRRVIVRDQETIEKLLEKERLTGIQTKYFYGLGLWCRCSPCVRELWTWYRPFDYKSVSSNSGGYSTANEDIPSPGSA